MIELSYINDEIFVFEVDDWANLRKNHRILGSLSGTITNLESLPFRLLPEETLFLIDEHIAKVVERNFDHTDSVKKYDDFTSQLFEEEKSVYKKIREKQLEHMIDDIVAAKRKRGDVRSKEEIYNEELEKSSTITKENMIWPLMLKSLSSVNYTEISRDVIEAKTTKTKYSVFKDLWKKGYYITSGQKFGADFLVYKGDPISYHAMFIVHCLNNSDEILDPTEIVAYGRLANSVRKKAVLATVTNNAISYITINWIDS